MKNKLKPILHCILFALFIFSILAIVLFVCATLGIDINERINIPEDNSVPSLSPHGAMSGTIG